MIQQSKPKSKPFQRRHNVRRSGPPVSQSSAAPGSIRQASATAEIWARSGKAFCALSSHACHVERETFASAAAFRWLRFASLRQCLSLLLIVCRQSQTSVNPKSCLSHRNVQHLQAKNHHAIFLRHRATGVFGLFAIFPGAIGHCIQPSNLPLTFKLLQKPAKQRPDLRRSGAKRCKFGVPSCIFQGRSLARTHARAGDQLRFLHRFFTMGFIRGFSRGKNLSVQSEKFFQSRVKESFSLREKFFQSQGKVFSVQSEKFFQSEPRKKKSRRLEPSTRRR